MNVSLIKVFLTHTIDIATTQDSFVMLQLVIIVNKTCGAVWLAHQPFPLFALAVIIIGLKTASLIRYTIFATEIVYTKVVLNSEIYQMVRVTFLSYIIVVNS